MLHAGLDLSRARLDYCLLDDEGGRVQVGAAPPDGDGPRGLVRRVELRHGPQAVHAAIESMNGARFVHDTLKPGGWEVEVADAQKVKGVGPLACKTDRIDAWVLAELSRAISCRRSGCRAFELRAERERAR
jgi:transposase